MAKFTTSLLTQAIYSALLLTTTTNAQVKDPKNPIVPGWYADPDAVLFGDTFWVYPTTSAGGTGEPHFDAFSSKDLVNWTKHPAVFSTKNSNWTQHSLWAPSVIERDGKYYMHYSANDPADWPHQPIYGIGVAVANNPAGPFIDPINKPIIDRFIGGGGSNEVATPIDQQVFHDAASGKDYFVWGNTRLKIAEFDLKNHKIKMDTLKDITPTPNYFEGPFIFKDGPWYYLMWSLGAWNGPDYRVAYASSKSLFGPFVSKGVVLQRDGKIADGPGHNGVVRGPKGQWWCVYHRRIIGDGVGGHRQLAFDRMNVHDGIIDPIKMT